MRIITIFCFFLFIFPPLLSAQNLSLPAIFSDGMILQRDQIISVNGSYYPDKKIFFSLGDESHTIFSDASGTWQVRLKARKAGGPYIMKIAGEGGEEIQFEDVFFGDVWLCAGQSNMNFKLSEEKSWIYESSCLNNPLLREFRCAMPPGQYNPENDEHSRWQSAIGGGGKLFSAVAYYFAKQIQTSENIPVGIIVMAGGGVRAESFVSYAALEKNIALQPMLRYWKGKMNNIVYPQHQVPGRFYDVVLKPVLPYPVKGVLFYQGESNTLPDNSGRTITERAMEYESIIRTLIADYRDTWKNPDLPFYLVQLPNYIQKENDIQWARIRQAQLNVAESITHTGLVVTIDVGDSTNLHPKNKKTVGERAAKWALYDAYGHKEILYSGPVIRHATAQKGVVIVSFDHVEGGLKAPDRLLGFELSDVSDPEEFHSAKAKIVGDKLKLTCSAIKQPLFIRYAWKDNPFASLFNGEGLPASPFLYEISIN